MQDLIRQHRDGSAAGTVPTARAVPWTSPNQRGASFSIPAKCHTALRVSSVQRILSLLATIVGVIDLEDVNVSCFQPQRVA